MFEVRSRSPMDEHWELRDRVIRKVAGPSEFSGAGPEGRDHGWHVPAMSQAQAFKLELEMIAGVSVTIREASSRAVNLTHANAVAHHDCPSAHVSVLLSRVLVALGFVETNAAARRAIEGGGVRVDDLAVTDPRAVILWCGNLSIRMGATKATTPAQIAALAVETLLEG